MAAVAQPVAQPVAQQQQVMMAPQPQVMMQMPFGRMPQQHRCGYCGQTAMTRVSYEAGMMTHGIAVGLCCFTGCLCFIPYLVDGMKCALPRPPPHLSPAPRAPFVPSPPRAAAPAAALHCGTI